MEVTAAKVTDMSDLMLKKAENNLGYLFDLAMNNPELAKKFFNTHSKCELPYPPEAAMMHLMGLMEGFIVSGNFQAVVYLKEYAKDMIAFDLRPKDYFGQNRTAFRGNR